MAVGSLLLSKPPVFIGDQMLEIVTPSQRIVQTASAIPIFFGAIYGLKKLPRILGEIRKAHVLGFMIIAIASGLALAAIFLQELQSLIYSFLFIACLYCAASTFVEGAKAQAQLFIGIAILSVAFVVSALAVFGPPQGRWIGGIHPNLFGFALVIPTAVLLVHAPKIGFPLSLACMAAAIAVSSRYAILIILLFVCLALAVYSVRRFGAALTYSVMIAISPIILIAAGGFLFDVFELADPNRGLGSGASGRAAMNSTFFDQFIPNAALGVGFRNRADYQYTHNGFLNFALESGLIISALFFSLLIAALYKMSLVSLRNLGQNKNGMTTTIVLFACIISAMFQPQLVNFGDSQGIVLIVALVFAIFSHHKGLPD